MIGVYDFCGHYDWTFEWLRLQGGKELVRDYWVEAIQQDSQLHARDLIQSHGIEGMQAYWGHTLIEEGAGYQTASTQTLFRIDMHDCPSRGFLIRNRLNQYHDYCDHCIGWIGPMMREASFEVDHQHNHRGQCWWEFHRMDDPATASGIGSVGRESDVRLREDWDDGSSPIDTFLRSSIATEDATS